MVRQPCERGPALVGAVEGRRPLMAVGVEDRHEDEVGAVEQFVLAAQGDVAQQHQPGILAVDLARMDSGLDQQHRLGARTGLGGADGVQIAALGGSPEAFDA